MLTVTIREPYVEQHILKLADAHNTAPDTIVLGAIAQQLGFPELVRSILHGSKAAIVGRH